VTENVVQLLILGREHDEFAVYAITTQYEGKSPVVKSHLLPINDWKSSGLHFPSFIDVGEIIYILKEYVDSAPLGYLSDGDKSRLIEFLAKRGG